MAAPATRSSPWLFGPVPDLFLGCGLAYGVVLLLLIGAGPQMRAILPIGLIPLLTLVTAVPHYGATALRVYEQRESRRAYAFFSVGATLFIMALFVGSLYSFVLGSWMYTIYLTWSPWHYTGQNYGLALMFLRRRGVEVTPTAKRLFYAAFLLGYALTFLAVHGESMSGVVYAPNAPGVGAKSFQTVYEFIPLGIPVDLQRGLLVACFIGYAATLLASGVLLLRRGSWSAIAPAAALVATQALWFVVPTLTRFWNVHGGIEPFTYTHQAYAFYWVMFAHSVQYLWVTSYYAKESGNYSGHKRYLFKCMLAGGALFGIPEIVSGLSFTNVPYHNGLMLMIAAAVNLHHFVLDGAIWKLRDSQIARILIRRDEPTDTPAPIDARPRRSWIRPQIWAIGAVMILFTVVSIFEFDRFRRARRFGDYPRMEVTAEHLRWVGRPNAGTYRSLGKISFERKDFDLAEQQFDRSLEIHQHPEAWLWKSYVHQKREHLDDAIDSLKAAYALDPYPRIIVRPLVRTLFWAGRFEEAEEVLAAGLENHPGDAILLDLAKKLREAAETGLAPIRSGEES